MMHAGVQSGVCPCALGLDRLMESGTEAIIISGLDACLARIPGPPQKESIFGYFVQAHGSHPSSSPEACGSVSPSSASPTQHSTRKQPSASPPPDINKH